MAEDLNFYFSSVFTKEDISSLPVADAKFQEAKSDYLGPLVVTPTPPWTVPSPAEKGGGLGVGLAPPPCKETQRYRNIHNK